MKFEEVHTGPTAQRGDDFSDGEFQRERALPQRTWERIKVCKMEDLVRSCRDNSIVFSPAKCPAAEGYCACRACDYARYTRPDSDPFRYANPKDLVRELCHSAIELQAAESESHESLTGPISQPSWVALDFSCDNFVHMVMTDVSSDLIASLIRLSLTEEIEIILGDSEKGLKITPKGGEVSVSGALSWAQEKDLTPLAFQNYEDLRARLAEIFPSGFQIFSGVRGRDPSGILDAILAGAGKRFYIKKCDSAGSNGLARVDMSGQFPEVFIPNRELSQSLGLDNGLDDKELDWRQVLDAVCRKFGAVIIEDEVDVQPVPGLSRAQWEVRMFMQRANSEDGFVCMGAYSDSMCDCKSRAHISFETHLRMLLDAEDAPHSLADDPDRTVAAIAAELESRLTRLSDDFCRLYSARYPGAQPVREVDIDYFMRWNGPKVEVIILEMHPHYSSYRGLAHVDPEKAKDVHAGRVIAAGNDSKLLDFLNQEWREAFGRRIRSVFDEEYP